MLNKTKTNSELPQTMGSTLNNKSVAQATGAGGVDTFIWRQMFALDSVIVKKQIVKVAWRHPN